MSRPLGTSAVLLLLLMAGLAACEQDDGAATARMEAESFAYPEGAALYRRQCSACHQQDGSGVGRHFPPLVDHAPLFARVAGGREHLIDVLLYGIGGEIEIAEQRYSGVMPGFRRMNNEQIAAIANHVMHAWGGDTQLPDGFEAIRPAEVEARRDHSPSPGEVRQARPDLP